MAEPKKKLSSTRSGNRRAHRALKAINASKCANCGEKVIQHKLCPGCGFYKGKKVLDIK
ncbi:MAG TPA: 50S ribosomal protein L32 [bacterium]|nr:50S ribosomal protein L32 [bacterium]HOR57513.1 50S ribosomal protein L32 [bacterium]HPL55931.1 50S ribosomal protein L32 [bacterium]